MNHSAHKMISFFTKRNTQKIQGRHHEARSQKFDHCVEESIQQPQSPLTLARLISRRSWTDVTDCLQSSKPAEWPEIDDKRAISEDNILHFACRFHAPLHIIKLLASRYPLGMNKPDSTGKFVIHVAAKYSALPDVIQFLVNENETAAGIQDDAGRTPIHYVGEFYVKHHDPLANKTVHDSMLQVVRILKAAAPKSVNLEDYEGCNAIELAIEGGADIKVVKVMQRAARDDWREMKANNGKKHEELAKDLERVADEVRMNTYKNILSPSNTTTNGQLTGNVLKVENQMKAPRDDSTPKSFVAKSA